MTKSFKEMIANYEKSNQPTYKFIQLNKDNSKEISYLKGNRGKEVFTPKRKKILEIMEYILTNKPIPPILINENIDEFGKVQTTVLEGNHRLYAFRELWKKGLNIALPAIFTNTTNYLSATRTINNKQTNWSKGQYILSDAINGDKEAEKIIELAHKLKLLKNSDEPSTRVIFTLLTGRDCSYNENIENGKYDFSQEQYENAEKLYNTIKTFTEKIERKYKMNIFREKFIIAWVKVKEDKNIQDTVKCVTDNWDEFIDNKMLSDLINEYKGESIPLKERLRTDTVEDYKLFLKTIFKNFQLKKLTQKGVKN